MAFKRDFLISVASIAAAVSGEASANMPSRGIDAIAVPVASGTKRSGVPFVLANAETPSTFVQMAYHSSHASHASHASHSSHSSGY